MLYDLDVSERYLVDITMETESLTNCFGEHFHTRGSTDGGMLGSWAEICCQPVSQEESVGMVAMPSRWTRSLCFLVQESRGSVLSMRGVCLCMREGEGKADSRKAAVGFVAGTCAFSLGV